jgi:hypothetical protein
VSVVVDRTLKVRVYRPGDEVAINDRFNDVFQARRTLDEWRWKFPPDPNGLLIVVAERGGVIVAQYAAIPTPFQIDGRVWSGAQIVDVFAGRSARDGIARHGAFVAVAEAFFDRFARSGRCPFLFGFPGPRHRRHGSLLLGYDEMGVQPVEHLWRRTPRAAARRRLGYRAEQARDPDPRLDELWSRISRQYPVAAVRDARWTRRRLSGHPSIRYHRFLLVRRVTSRPVAFVAFRTDQERCRWVDLVWDHDHPGALDLMLHLSERLVAQTGAAIEEMWLNGDPQGLRHLEANGFAAAPEAAGLALTGKSFSADLDLSTVASRAYLTMADADLV